MDDRYLETLNPLMKLPNIPYTTSYSWKEDRFSSLMRPESFYVPESLILHTTMVPWHTLVVGLLSTVFRCNCNPFFKLPLNPNQAWLFGQSIGRRGVESA